jgi:hypothetical protein
MDVKPKQESDVPQRLHVFFRRVHCELTPIIGRVHLLLKQILLRNLVVIVGSQLMALGLIKNWINDERN